MDPEEHSFLGWRTLAHPHRFDLGGATAAGQKTAIGIGAIFAPRCICAAPLQCWCRCSEPLIALHGPPGASHRDRHLRGTSFPGPSMRHIVLARLEGGRPQGARPVSPACSVCRPRDAPQRQTSLSPPMILEIATQPALGFTLGVSGGRGVVLQYSLRPRLVGMT